MTSLNLLVALTLSVTLPDSLSMFLANRSAITNYDATVQWTTATPAGEPSTCRTRFRATADGKVAVNQLGYANGAVEIDWNGLTMEASPIGYFFDGSRSYNYADDDLLVEVRNGYGEHPPITAPISYLGLFDITSPKGGLAIVSQFDAWLELMKVDRAAERSDGATVITDLYSGNTIVASITIDPTKGYEIASVIGYLADGSVSYVRTNELKLFGDKWFVSSSTLFLPGNPVRIWTGVESLSFEQPELTPECIGVANGLPVKDYNAIVLGEPYVNPVYWDGALIPLDEFLASGRERSEKAEAIVQRSKTGEQSVGSACRMSLTRLYRAFARLYEWDRYGSAFCAAYGVNSTQKAHIEAVVADCREQAMPMLRLWRDKQTGRFDPVATFDACQQTEAKLAELFNGMVQRLNAVLTDEQRAISTQLSLERINPRELFTGPNSLPR